MFMSKTLPITKVRENLTKIVDRANRLLEEYVVTVNGEPTAVILSHSEYESWTETMEILIDPDLMRAIKEGEEDVKKGNYVTFDTLKKDLKLHV